MMQTYKTIGIVFLFLLWRAWCCAHSVVFVQLGPKLPPYLADALTQVRLFNKDCPLYLIGNRAAMKTFSQLAPLNVTLVPIEELPKTKEHKRFLKETTLDASFRDGFWLYASERFFYLYDFLAKYKLADIIHIESDNLLYVDLEELLPLLQKQYHNIAAVFDNDGRCIPSFMYFARQHSLHYLIRTFLEHTGKHDMEVPALCKKKWGYKAIQTLPIIPREYFLQYGLQSPMGHTTQKPKEYFRNIELFNSIFDGAALGQYLGGIDPRNGESKPGFINESCLFDPSKLRFSWKEDSQKRRVPYLSFAGRSLRINNLHIHSKNLKLFLSQPLPTPRGTSQFPSH